jgi:antirestriction protein ArdC
LSLGGHVRKGERGTTVIYADRFVPVDEKRRAHETGEEAQAVPFLKRFTVFNSDQCDGLPPQIATTAPPPPPGLIEPQVEYLIKATGMDFRIGGNRAFYAPTDDYVQVPPPQAYFEPINWHRTALHELAHASGHPSRLNRDLSGSYGTRSYAFEELVAEISSAFGCASRHRADGAARRLYPLVARSAARGQSRNYPGRFPGQQGRRLSPWLPPRTCCRQDDG